MKSLIHIVIAFSCALAFRAEATSIMRGLPIYEARRTIPRRTDTLLKVYDFLDAKCRAYTAIPLSIQLRPDKEYYVFILVAGRETNSEERASLNRDSEEWKKEIGKTLINEYMEGHVTSLMKEKDKIYEAVKSERAPERRLLLEAVMNDIVAEMKDIQDDLNGVFDIVVSESENAK